MHRGDALAVSFLELAQTLSGGYLPDDDLSGLGAGSQHLAVAGETKAQHSLLHHHEVVLKHPDDMASLIGSGNWCRRNTSMKLASNGEKSFYEYLRQNEHTTSV